MSISIADIQAHPAEAMAALIETVKRQGEEIDQLKREQKLDRADIRDIFDAIDSFDHAHISPAQKDRGEVLRALIAANGGKMLAKEARQKMNVSKSTFSRLLAGMTDYLEIRPLKTDRRLDIIILKSKLVSATNN